MQRALFFLPLAVAQQQTWSQRALKEANAGSPSKTLLPLFRAGALLDKCVGWPMWAGSAGNRDKLGNERKI